MEGEVVWLAGISACALVRFEHVPSSEELNKEGTRGQDNFWKLHLGSLSTVYECITK
jgi:hypothetical protein